MFHNKEMTEWSNPVFKNQRTNQNKTITFISRLKCAHNILPVAVPLPHMLIIPPLLLESSYSERSSKHTCPRVFNFCDYGQPSPLSFVFTMSPHLTPTSFLSLTVLYCQEEILMGPVASSIVTNKPLPLIMWPTFFKPLHVFKTYRLPRLSRT